MALPSTMPVSGSPSDSHAHNSKTPSPPPADETKTRANRSRPRKPVDDPPTSSSSSAAAADHAPKPSATPLEVGGAASVTTQTPKALTTKQKLKRVLDCCGGKSILEGVSKKTEKGRVTSPGSVGPLARRSFCWQDRCVPLDKSSVFFFQALFFWCVICLPGNIVTFVLYQRTLVPAGPLEGVLTGVASVEFIEVSERIAMGVRTCFVKMSGKCEKRLQSFPPRDYPYLQSFSECQDPIWNICWIELKFKGRTLYRMWEIFS